MNDGGPAFPTNNNPECFNASGMSLRDWFAGMALRAIYCNNGDVEADAKEAYAVADAMIAERSRQK